MKKEPRKLISMRGWRSAVLYVAQACMLTSPAWADAFIERYSRSDGFAGMGAFESTSVTVTTATAQRSESSLKFTGGFMSALQKMAGAGEHVRITRLDKELVWTLDPEKKTYTEAPLTLRGERERQDPASGTPRREKPEASDVVITKNEFTVKQTGAKKTINGLPCEEYLATWVVETLNQKTRETGTSTMTTHLWTTPETSEMRAVRAEEQAYQRAYLQKLKLQMSPEEARTFGMAALAGAVGLSDAEQQKAMARLVAEMSKIKGYPIVTQVEWQVEGSGASQEAHSPPGRSGGPPPGLGDLGGALGKLFGGGGQQSGGAETAPSGSEGPRPVFRLYTEVKTIKVGSPDPTRYEVPAGYTKN